ncbi:MAG: hypothetical protein Fur007_01920 [Rhodoferax sp.]
MDLDARSGLRFYAALVALVGLVAAMTGYSLWLMRGDAVRSGLQVSALMARSFENFLTQSISTTQATAASLLARSERRRSASAIGVEFNHLLRHAPYLRSLSVIDARDQIVASSNPANVGVAVSTLDFLPQVPTGQAALRIGKPWLGRDFDDAAGASAQGLSAQILSSVVPVVYPLEGAPTGWRLLAAMNPDFFVHHMLQQVDERTGVVDILRLDGTLLMSTQLPTQTAAVHSGAMSQLNWGEQEFGQFESVSLAQEATLTAFRVSALYPFVVVSRLNREQALEPWYLEVRTIVGLVTPSTALAVVLAVVYYRRQRVFKAQRAESERLQRINAACVFDNTREGIIISAGDGTIVDVNPAFTRITGYSRDEVIGKNPRILNSGRQDKAFYQAMWQELDKNGYWSGEVWNRRKDGEIFAEILTISAVTDSADVVQYYVAVFTNITSMKQYQSELEHIARFDSLTDLPNRLLLTDRLQQAMHQTVRRQNLLAVAFIDLDGFKAVNDQHGHRAGDLVLATVAQRMQQALREGDTLARNGGDEFVAVLVDLPMREQALVLAERLLAAAAQPIAHEGVPLQVSASIGLSFYPQHPAPDLQALLRQADEAMYQAKQSGKNQYAIYREPQSIESPPSPIF